jgi:uncharacterized protein with NRDE domain
MCLILFSWKQHPKYKLILGANRDEFLARSTQQAHFWENEPTILGGKDLERGGTWMGLNKAKEFSALTNFREITTNMPEPNRPSRGFLTSDFLKSEQTPNAYLEGIHKNSNSYEGFNLLVGDRNKLFHYSNRENKINELESGSFGLSNALLDTEWPKVELGKSLLSDIIRKEEVETEAIFEMLRNTNAAPDENLPKTGISQEWEKALSTMFIKKGNYGTRCSSVILWDYSDRITFTERTYDLTEPNTVKFGF